MSTETEPNNLNADSKPYDLSTIVALCDNNQPFLEKLLVVFAENVDKDLQTLKAAAAANNWHEVGQMAHKMKSSLTHFGVKGIKELMQTLEHYSNVGADTLKSRVAEFDTIITDVLKNLKQDYPAVFK